MFGVILLTTIAAWLIIPHSVQSQGQDRVLEVTTILEKPYMIKKQGWQKLSGNDQFEGYIKDLMDKVARIAGFNYTLHLSLDGKYGSLEGDGKTWNGMISELTTGKADIAAAALIVSYTREQVVDFSKPFMDVGISILMKKPSQETTFVDQVTTILEPFSTELWIYIIIAYIGLSSTLFFLGRFTEWLKFGENEVNEFTYCNSLWYLFVLPGKSGHRYLSPSSLSTRIISATWWIFSFFLIAAYILRLYVVLTTPGTLNSPIMNAEELSMQMEVKYGAVASGSTSSFFKASKIPVYHKMWTTMAKTEPTVFVRSTEEGIRRVLNGKYAFLTESSVIQYTINRNCQLMQVGGLLDSKSYGFAVKKGSTLKSSLDQALLQMQEDQTLQSIYNKWFVSGMCVAAYYGQGYNSLSVRQFIGAFLVLASGVLLALFTGIIECLCLSYKKSADRKMMFCKQVSKNLSRTLNSCCDTIRGNDDPDELFLVDYYYTSR